LIYDDVVEIRTDDYSVGEEWTFRLHILHVLRNNNLLIFVESPIGVMIAIDDRMGATSTSGFLDRFKYSSDVHCMISGLGYAQSGSAPSEATGAVRSQTNLVGARRSNYLETQAQSSFL
jgi:hypothetical protein